jgi:hypothetical protein
MGTIEVNGPPETITTSIPGQRGVLTFNGVAGQWIRLTVLSTTVPRTQSFSPPAFINIVAPDGTYLGGVANFTNAFDTPPLPVNGTYTVIVDPLNDATGSTTLSLAEVPPVGSISIDGPPFNVTAHTGRISRLTFDATAGQRVSLKAATFWGAQVSLYGPDAALLANASIERFSSGAAFIDTITLPTTGTYHVAVTSRGSGDGTAPVTLTLYGVNEVTGTVATDGSPTQVTFTKPGQNARLTFDTVAGQRLGLSITNVTVQWSNLRVINSDGVELLYSYFFGTQGAFIELQPMSTTGTNSILLDPEGANTGDMTVILFEISPDVTAVMDVNGPPKNLTIASPGQRALATFNGAAGQVVTVKTNVSGVTDCFEVYLVAPDGSFLTGDFRCADGVIEFTGLTLPEDGVYTLTIDPSRSGTGTFSVAVTSP